MLYPPTNSPILIFSTFDTPSKSSQTTKRPARAKALIINAFALAGRLAFINPYTQGGCPRLCAYWAFSPSFTKLLVLPDSNN